jgi:hypothetical protein
MGISFFLFLAALFVLWRSGVWPASPARGRPVPDEGKVAAFEPAAVTATAGGAGDSPAPATRAAEVLPRPGEVRFHGLLDAVSDYDDIAQNQAYAALASHVRRLTNEEAARIRRDDLTFEKLMEATPEARRDMRGELVKVLGILIRFEPVRLVPGAGPEGVTDAWRGWLIDPSGEECWVFDTLAAPPPVDLRRDLVAVEGAFLKIFRYETNQWRCPRCNGIDPLQVCPEDGARLEKGGKCPECGRKIPRLCREDRTRMVETRDAPFLLARRVWVVADDEVQKTPYLPPVAILAIALVALPVFAMGVIRAVRGRGEGIETLVRRKRRNP